MLDQAEALRLLVKDRTLCCREILRASRVYTVAVTSGKGGVGKTSIAVNLAVLLARGGMRVRLIDADFGLSNAEVLLGVTPKYTLHDIIEGRIHASDAWVEAECGVRLLSSGSGLAEMANLGGSTGAGLIGHALNTVSDGEVVVIDTSPGIDCSVVSLLSSVSEVLVVTTPEPTSITDTYAAIKVLTTASPESKVTLVTNSCANPAHGAAIAKGIDSICRRFLGRSFVGHEFIPSDEAVGRAIRAQNPFVIVSPNCGASAWMKRLAIKVGDRARRHETALIEPMLMGA